MPGTYLAGETRSCSEVLSSAGTGWIATTEDAGHLDDAIRSGAHRYLDVAIAEWILAAPDPVETVARVAVIMAEATAEAHGTAATTPSVALLLSMECSVLHHQRGGT